MADREGVAREAGAQMKLSLVIPGPVVPWARAGGTFVTRDGRVVRANPKRYQRYRNHVRSRVELDLKRLQIRDWTLRGPFRLSLTFHFPDLRRRDGDNCEKGILDALKGVLWEDDTWEYFRLPGWVRRYATLDAHSPRVNIEVEAV